MDEHREITLENEQIIVAVQWNNFLHLYESGDGCHRPKHVAQRRNRTVRV